jgi:hypothetical protein
MKKIFSLLIIIAAITTISCKKESTVTPAVSAENAKSVKQITPVYNYQKAILEKRSVGGR